MRAALICRGCGQYADDHGVWVVWSERQQRIDALRRELGCA